VKFLGPAVLALLVAVPSVAAPPVTEASLAVSLAEYSAGARFPLPELTAAQLKRLLAGKVVKVREALEEDAPQRAIGLTGSRSGSRPGTLTWSSWTSSPSSS
jgi:hypothetical protein